MLAISANFFVVRMCVDVTEILCPYSRVLPESVIKYQSSWSGRKGGCAHVASAQGIHPGGCEASCKKRVLKDFNCSFVRLLLAGGLPT